MTFLLGNLYKASFATVYWVGGTSNWYISGKVNPAWAHLNSHEKSRGSASLQWRRKDSVLNLVLFSVHILFGHRHRLGWLFDLGKYTSSVNLARTSLRDARIIYLIQTITMRCLLQQTALVALKSSHVCVCVCVSVSKLRMLLAWSKQCDVLVSQEATWQEFEDNTCCAFQVVQLLRSETHSNTTHHQL